MYIGLIKRFKLFAGNMRQYPPFLSCLTGIFDWMWLNSLYYHHATGCHAICCAPSFRSLSFLDYKRHYFGYLIYSTTLLIFKHFSKLYITYFIVCTSPWILLKLAFCFDIQLGDFQFWGNNLILAVVLIQRWVGGLFCWSFSISTWNRCKFLTVHTYHRIWC